MPLSIDSAIRYFQMATSIQALEFYVLKHENRAPELGCHILEDGIALMTKQDAEDFCEELNKAIRNVTEPWRIKYTTKVSENAPV